MSISLYCKGCSNYMGHLHPDFQRNYVAPPEARRNDDFLCRQCEAEAGLYEARIHARENWNLSMRGHQQIVEECKLTVHALCPTSVTRLSYSIGSGGYTVLEPAHTHSWMFQRFTSNDIVCLRSVKANILTCSHADLINMRSHRVSETFAIWVALMRHVECSKMTCVAVSKILTRGLTELEQEVEKTPFLLQSKIRGLGNYLSAELNRTTAEGRGAPMHTRNIPSTPVSSRGPSPARHFSFSAKSADSMDTEDNSGSHGK